MNAFKSNDIEQGADRQHICPRCKRPTHTERVHRELLVKTLLGWLPVPVLPVQAEVLQHGKTAYGSKLT